MAPSARCAALLISLGLLASADKIAAAPKQAQDCRLKQLASLDLVLRDGGVLVPVTLNGHAGYMELELAYARSYFYQGAADAMGLPHRYLNGRVATYWDGELIKQSATFDSLVLGNATFANGEFVVAPIPDNGDVFGTLGMTFFAPVDFELDLRHKTMKLFSQDHCEGEVVYWSEQVASVPLKTGVLGDLFFDMVLEGKKVATSWSPSESMTTITSDATRNLFGFDEKSAGVEVERDASGNTVAHYRAMQLSAPGLTARNTKIVLVDDDAGGGCGKSAFTGTRMAQKNDCLSKPPLRLGRNVLESMRLYFATKDRMLYFTAADE